MFFKGVISLTTNKNGTSSSKSNAKDKEIEYNFLIIYRYLNLVRNKRIILQQLESSQGEKNYQYRP